ncbi:hypothetical protein AB0M02_12670 [Actinoplanes sp. NPDC051861]|uniref:hypothetical protein n=1 Tax=Actinoplanes sp. NPDC051861 TaxID=3155170 RepID=UPI00342D98B6
MTKDLGKTPEDFKKLPPRILPDDHVELVETRQAEARPWPAPSEAQERAVYGAGG